MTHYFFTSESVAQGHPDKIADQISDAILDACLSVDSESKVACEALVSGNLVVLAGEITTGATLNYPEIVRETIRRIGYDDPTLGFDAETCAIMTSINRQSPDIAQGVLEGQGTYKEQGAGDQGMMFGFACDETSELMPLPITLSHQIILELQKARKTGAISYLRPDAKAQVTMEYDEQDAPVSVDTIVLSTQHSEDVTQETLTKDMQSLIQRVIPSDLLRSNTRYLVNPTGRFVIGGPVGDCGLTGRKVMVDTYGGMGRHGGGAFSGKDPSKVDRSAAYMARYVAKNIVAAKLARRCEVQLSYAIGFAEPISIKVDLFGTGVDGVTGTLLTEAVPRVFQLTPRGIVESLNLKRAIYSKTSFGGHFGRQDSDFTWERLDKVDELLKLVNELKSGRPVQV